MINKDDFDIPGSLETDVYDAYSSYNDFLNALKRVPLKTLQEHNILKSYDDIDGIARLYNSCERSSQILFRKNPKAEDQLTMIWQSKVMSDSLYTYLNDNIKPFNGITQAILAEFAKLSVDVNSILKMPQILANYGIILQYNRSLPSMKLDGSVSLLPTGNPVVGLSFRYPRLDYYWFTLMHELAHICLHYEALSNPILDNLEDSDFQQLEQEVQANRFAKYSLVDKISWRNCKPKYTGQEYDVREYAAQLGIHPAIVAGLLHNEINDYSKFQKIVNEVDVRKLVFGDV